MKLLIRSIFLILSIEAYGQSDISYQQNPEIKIQIAENKITLQRDAPYLELNVCLSNKGNINYLLYGFKNLFPSPYPEDEVIDPYSAGGNHILLLKENKVISAFIYPPLPGRTEINLDSTEYISAVNKRSTNFMRNKMVVLNANDSVKIRLRATRSKNKLIAGEYEIYLIYSLGVSIMNVIGAANLAEDEEKNNAILFKGYLKTPRIKLLVQ